jgi:hypothetical protein
MRWAVIVTRGRDIINAYEIVFAKPEAKRPSGRQTYAQIILKCILRKQGMRIWTGFIWLRTGSSGWLL